MSIVIQKFGGRCLLNDSLRAAAVDQVKSVLNRGKKPIVVVSALGRQGDPYATDTLLKYMEAFNAYPSPRSVDMLVSCGETMAAALFAELLAAQGLVATAFTGGQAGVFTDNRYGDARITKVDPGRLLDTIESGTIPVVAGFQGVNGAGDITTIGRGGSDTTAAAIGAAVQAEWIDIFTDVDGVKTADPSIVPNAGTIDQLTYQEVVEMAHLGAKVIHPRAVEIAMDKGVPMRIRSVLQLDGGTIIGSLGQRRSMGAALIDERVVAGIAHMVDRAKVQVHSDTDLNTSGLALQIFQRLAEAQVSVDLIYLSPDRIGFIVDAEKTVLTEKVLAQLGVEAEVKAGFAKVSVVGAGMHGVPGVMARIVGCLEAKGIPILQTTDSHANISCLIHQEHLASAVSTLHREFGLV